MVWGYWEDRGGLSVLPQALDLLELLWGKEPPRDAPLGLGDEPAPVLLARAVGLPRREMPLLAEPLQVAAVDNGLHLVLSLFGIPDPPSEFHAHGRGNSATSWPGRNSPPLSSTWRIRILSADISAVIAPKGLQKEPVLTTTMPDSVFQTPGLWVWPITMKRAVGRWLRANAAALTGASRQARRTFRTRLGGQTVSPASRIA